MLNTTLIEKGRYVNPKILVVGIDIGKRMHVAAGTSIHSGYTKPFYIRNNRESYEAFELSVEGWRKKFGCNDVIFGFESTGHYWKPLVYYLLKKGRTLVEVSTNYTKKAKELMDNSPLKCDVKDARVIADLVKQGKILTPVFPEGSLLSLREIVHTRENLIKERTSILNRVGKIMDITFPERGEVIKKIGNKTSLFLLQEAPFPEMIIAKGRMWLQERMKKVSRGRYTEYDTRRLYILAIETVGIKEGRDGSFYELRVLLPRLKCLNREIEDIESRMEEMLEDIEESRYILSIGGVSVIIAAAIIAESGGLNNYHKASSVLKVAGLNLYEVSSGEHKGAKHITKRGRSLMRQKLFFAALHQAQKGMPLHSFYRRLVDNGVDKIKALTAVARKLLRIMFALVRDKTMFIAHYEDIMTSWKVA